LSKDNLGATFTDGAILSVYTKYFLYIGNNQAVVHTILAVEVFGAGDI
jgi:hypothetical protein